MDRDPGFRFEFRALPAGLAADGVWFVVLRAQRLCGALSDTALGDATRYVPGALLIAEALVVAALGRRPGRRRGDVALAIAGVSVVAAVIAAAIFVLFAAGHCGV